MARLRTVKHTVKPGETLWNVAATHLGDGQRWPEVFHWNVMNLVGRRELPAQVNPNFLKVGDELVVYTNLPDFQPSQDFDPSQK